MVKKICKDIFFLSQKAEPATKADIQVGQDLLDTLKANKYSCVGMAENMIGVNKAIIAVSTGLFDILMYNPKIIKKAKPYISEEGCLSLEGLRKATRYQEIEVEYQDVNFNSERNKFTGYIAQIIEHEIDHLSGIII